MNKKLVDYFILISGLSLIAFIWFILFKNLPTGLLLVVIGAIFTKMANFATTRAEQIIGTLGSWLYPIGIVLTFISLGWLWGIGSILLALYVYRMSKEKA